MSFQTFDLHAQDDPPSRNYSGTGPQTLRPEENNGPAPAGAPRQELHFVNFTNPQVESKRSDNKKFVRILAMRDAVRKKKPTNKKKTIIHRESSNRDVSEIDGKKARSRKVITPSDYTAPIFNSTNSLMSKTDPFGTFVVSPDIIDLKVVDKCK
jgi:hypothetical protein